MVQRLSVTRKFLVLPIFIILFDSFHLQVELHGFSQIDSPSLFIHLQSELKHLWLFDNLYDRHQSVIVDIHSYNIILSFTKLSTFFLHRPHSWNQNYNLDIPAGRSIRFMIDLRLVPATRSYSLIPPYNVLPIWDRECHSLHMRFRLIQLFQLIPAYDLRKGWQVSCLYRAKLVSSCFLYLLYCFFV